MGACGLALPSEKSAALHKAFGFAEAGVLRDA